MKGNAGIEKLFGIHGVQEMGQERDIVKRIKCEEWGLDKRIKRKRAASTCSINRI